MKLTWDDDYTVDDEKLVNGWVMVDLSTPDPIFNRGYGAPVLIMTKSKTCKKKPTSAQYKEIVKSLKAKMVLEFKNTAMKLKP